MTSTTSLPLSRARHDRRLLAAALLLPLLLVAAGCSADESADSASYDSDAAADVAQDAPAQDTAGARSGEESAGDSEGGQAAPASLSARPPSVIATGVVAMTSKDPDAARAEVVRIVDVARGQITDEEATSDEDGAVRRTRLVVRVPVAEFGETMTAFEKVGTLVSSDRSSEDVSAEVIDTEVRIRAQERSLKRIELLLDRAQKIGDIVSIESELTRRQADLDALKQTQAYYADQTAMSTITVHLSRTGKPAEPTDEEAGGFLAGLRSGWGALVSFATVAATVAGALLPWTVVLLALGLPLWLVVRRRAARSGAGQVPEATPGS